MAAMVSAGSYHLLKHVHRRWRRFSHKPIWRDLLANTAWWTVLFLLVIPLAVLVGTMTVRTHTTHYLLTGPPGSTADHLGPRIVDVLNMPTKLERFLHLNIVPDFVAKQSCGSQVRRQRGGHRNRLVITRPLSIARASPRDRGARA